jgi:hypothetical protein
VNDPQERFEQQFVSLARGPKGDKGDAGKRGEGMTRGARRAFAFLAVLSLLLAVTSILVSVQYVQTSEASQRRQGVIIEQKLCTTLGRLASRQPPPSTPGDLSRQYLEWQHQQLAELSPDVGCPKA